METKTLDERIRERGKSDWANRVRSVAAGVNSLTSGDLRNQRMEITTTAQGGKHVMTIWQCIERLFGAIEAAGAEKAGEDAVVEFLKRFDDVAANLDDLRANQNT